MGKRRIPELPSQRDTAHCLFLIILVFLFPQGLSRVRDGLLICEIDLNLIQQIRDKWCLQVVIYSGDIVDSYNDLHHHR